MRVCQKCGAYYADVGLAFCLADGAPLVNVEPTSESWGEGVRFIEEKEKAWTKQKRRLKWRRVVVTATTMSVATVVVCVVVINSYIYLKPRRATGPASTPSPTLSPTPSPTLSPTRTPTPECSDDGESRERETIIESFGDTWRRSIEGERDKIIARHTPAGVANANSRAGVNANSRVGVNANGRVGVAAIEAALGAIEYEISFPKACTASVAASYAWQVRIFNATPTGQAVEEVSDAGGKTFACVKVGAAWSCR